MENDQEEKYSVLIIDDEKWAREITENYIKQCSEFEIKDTAGTALEATKLLQKQRYDLIFMEMLPGMNGIKILSELTHSPNVIFTTVKREFALKAFEIGVIDYLLKPISAERFEIAINRALEILNYRKTNLTRPEVAPIQEVHFLEIDLEDHLQEAYSLTLQEAIICQHLYEGRSREEIRDLLNIAEQTLKQHLRSIFAKTIDLETTNPSKKHGKMHMLMNFLIRQAHLSPDSEDHPQ